MGTPDTLQKPSLLKNISYCLYFIFLTTAAVYTFNRPAYNWDMLAYMAVALSIDNASPELVHQTVYHTAARELPADSYRLLTDTTHAFRKQALENPAFFHHYLPFYTIKPLYAGLVYIFYKSGLSLVKATVLPGTISYFLLGALFFYWIRRYTGTLLSVMISILAMASAPLLALAELSTPDCLSALILFAAAFFIIERKKVLPAVLLVVLLVLTRIDNIIAGFFILSLATFSTRTTMRISLKSYFSMMLLLALTYTAISYIPYTYGWNMFFISGFFKESAIFIYKRPFSFREYFLVRHSALMVAMLVYHLFLYLLMAALVFIDSRRPFRWRHFSFDQQWIITLLLIICCRFFLYPDLGDRYNMGYYMIITVLLIRKISGLVSTKQEL